MVEESEKYPANKRPASSLPSNLSVTVSKRQKIKDTDDLAPGNKILSQLFNDLIKKYNNQEVSEKINEINNILFRMAEMYKNGNFTGYAEFFSKNINTFKTGCDTATSAESMLKILENFHRGMIRQCFRMEVCDIYNNNCCNNFSSENYKNIYSEVQIQDAINFIVKFLGQIQNTAFGSLSEAFSKIINIQALKLASPKIAAAIINCIFSLKTLYESSTVLELFPKPESQKIIAETLLDLQKHLSDMLLGDKKIPDYVPLKMRGLFDKTKHSLTQLNMEIRNFLRLYNNFNMFLFKKQGATFFDPVLETELNIMYGDFIKAYNDIQSKFNWIINVSEYNHDQIKLIDQQVSECSSNINKASSSFLNVQQVCALIKVNTKEYIDAIYNYVIPPEIDFEFGYWNEKKKFIKQKTIKIPRIPELMEILESLENNPDASALLSLFLDMGISTTYLLPERESSKKLKEVAQFLNMTLVDVQTDGNCLFEAVAAQLNTRKIFSGKNYTANELRLLAVKYMMEHSQHYQGFVEADEGKTFEGFIHEMKQPGTWAENKVLDALSRALNINIAVFNSDSSRPIILKNEDAKGNVYLGYEIGLHYQSLSGDSMIAQAYIDQADCMKSIPSNEQINLVQRNQSFAQNPYTGSWLQNSPVPQQSAVASTYQAGETNFNPRQ